MFDALAFLPKSEVLLSEGLIEYNANRFDQAQQKFKEALTLDSKNYLALEYLGSIAEKSKQYTQAMSQYQSARQVAPLEYFGALDFHMGRVCMLLNDLNCAVSYLEKSLNENGPVVQTSYLLGYVYYKQGDDLQAEYYLSNAKKYALTQSYFREHEREVLQSIYFYLGSIYARLGYTKFSITQLNAAEPGQSWEVRKSAWELHSRLNQMLYFLSAEQMFEYDTNVIVYPFHSPVPLLISDTVVSRSFTKLFLGAQTSATKTFSLGINGNLGFQKSIGNESADLDTLSLVGEFWAEVWNKRSWTLRMSYLPQRKFIHSSYIDPLFQSHRLNLGLRYFPYQRWVGEAGFFYVWNQDLQGPQSGVDERNGQALGGYLEFGLKSPGEKLKPSVRYEFIHDQTEGSNFQSQTHYGKLSLNYRALKNTYLDLNFSLAHIYFFHHKLERGDKVYSVNPEIQHIINMQWSLFAHFQSMYSVSTLEPFSFNRNLTTLGVKFNL